MKVVIIGAGPAGVTVAETLRQYDTRSEIVMLSSEPYPPYSPPAMVAYFTTGQEVHLWKGRDFPERLDIDYRQGTKASGIDPQKREVHLADGGALRYDRLVIASGGRLYAARLEEFKPGVYNFKSLSAAEELLAHVKEGARTALIIGAGFIGVEIALLLRDIGLEVTQLVRSRVMRQMLDPETSEIVLGMLKDRGIQVRRGDDADAVAFVGKPRAEAVEVRSGDVVSADLLIAATGLRPNIEFLEGSGVRTEWGVLVDDHLRTNDPAVYAVGDVAETFDRFTGERYVHAIFPNAVEQGRVAAYNLLGRDTVYEGSDTMNSLKHLGLPIIAVGQMTGEELRVCRNGVLRKVYVEDDRIVGFRLTGDVRTAGILRSLMNKRANVGPLKGILLAPGFGMGVISEMALAAQQLI